MRERERMRWMEREEGRDFMDKFLLVLHQISSPSESNIL